MKFRLRLARNIDDRKLVFFGIDQRVSVEVIADGAALTLNDQPLSEGDEFDVEFKLKREDRPLDFRRGAQPLRKRKQRVRA